MDRGVMAQARGLLVALLLLGSCTFEWDRYDPRLGSSPADGGTGGGGAGAGGEFGGATTTGGYGGDGAAAGQGGQATGGFGGANTGGGGGGSTTSSTTSTTGSGGDGGSGGGGGGGGPLDCGTVEMLGDNFEDGLIDETVWDRFAMGDPTAPTVVESGGTRNIVLAPSSDQWGGFITPHHYDLTGRRLAVEVTSMVTTSGSAEADFAIGINSDGQAGFGEARFRQQHGNLVLEYWVEASHTVIATLTYNPTVHHWLALREEAGTLFWETSEDGVTFTPRGQRAAAQLFPLNMVWAMVAAGVGPGEANPGTASFDNLAGGGPANGGWCATSSLSDDFEDGVLSTEWYGFDDGNCTVNESGGRLSFDAGVDEAYCEAQTRRAFDLTADAAVLELAAMPEVSSYVALLRLQRGAGDFLQIDQSDGTLYVSAYLAGEVVGVTSVPWNAAAHRFWRIREDQGEIYWETSANGTDWTWQFNMQSPFPVTALQTKLWLNKFAGAALQVAYESYNAGP